MEIIREIKDENDFPVRRLTQGFVMSIYSDNVEREITTRRQKDKPSRLQKEREKEIENHCQVEIWDKYAKREDMSRKEGRERNNTDRKPLPIVSLRPIYKQRRYEYVDNKKKEREKRDRRPLPSGSFRLYYDGSPLSPFSFFCLCLMFMNLSDDCRKFPSF